MRKVYVFMMVSLDGFFEGANHDLSWHNVDEEFNDFAIKQLKATDTLLFGHSTYDMMASYWPSKETVADDPVVAGLMNSAEKIVFSHKPLTADWENTTVAGDVEVVRTLKQTEGQDIAVLGSSNLCLSLIEAGLLDEYRLMINPVVVGTGTTLFTGLPQPLSLTLVADTRFTSGNMLLTYHKK